MPKPPAIRIADRLGGVVTASLQNENTGRAILGEPDRERASCRPCAADNVIERAGGARLVGIEVFT